MIRLIVMLKGRTIGRFDVEGEKVRIGRHPDNEVQIDNNSVSRFHCALDQDANGIWSVEDRGSHNGTFVNGARIQRMVLKSGDTVGVGQFQVAVRTEESPSQSTHASRQIAVRSFVDPAKREELAPEKGFLVLQNRPGPPIPLVRDLLQVGSEPGLDIHLEGARKAALFVRGHGGFQLVNVDPDPQRVRCNGKPVPDRIWLPDGVRLEIGDLQLTFHQGMPSEDQSTMVIQLPPELLNLPPGLEGRPGRSEENRE